MDNLFLFVLNLKTQLNSSRTNIYRDRIPEASKTVIGAPELVTGAKASKTENKSHAAYMASRTFSDAAVVYSIPSAICYYVQTLVIYFT